MVDKTFLGNLKLRPKDLFESRKDYRIKAVPQNSIHMIDFWYGSKLYGKVDTYGNAVYPLSNSTLLLEQVPENNSPLITPFFITSPLINLKREYAGMIINNEVKPLPMYDQFDVKRSMIDLDRLYSEHRSSLLNYFVFDYLQARQDCIKTFDDLVYLYLEFMKSYGKDQPLTKTSFIMLPRVTNAISGLILDLDLDQGNDDSLKESFFEDECAFTAFQHAAARNGFFMDKNKPWRIIANVNSSRFLAHADISVQSTDQPTRQTTQSFFDTYYAKAYEEDHFLVTNFILSAYGIFFSKNRNISVDKKMLSGMIRRVNTSRFVPQNNSSSQKNIDFWHSLTFRTRLIETGIEHSLINRIAKNITWLKSDDAEWDYQQNLETINNITKLYDPRLSKK